MASLLPFLVEAPEDEQYCCDADALVSFGVEGDLHAEQEGHVPIKCCKISFLILPASCVLKRFQDPALVYVITT